MIFGEFSRKQSAKYAKQLIALSNKGTLTQFIPADITRHWRDKQTLLVQHTIWNTLESHADNGPLYDIDAHIVISAWARIDNREELSKHLDMNAADETLPDIQFILNSYKKWESQCVNYLIGDFAFVIWDVRKQSLFCARDHMGVRPLYYHLSEQNFLFSSTLKVFVDLKDFDLSPSKKWIAEYLAGLSMSFDKTPYQSINKLAPGFCLTITPEKSELRRYHQLSGDTRIYLNNNKEYVEAYQEQLERAIQCRLRSTFKIGSELSGGLDSSTLTAYAAEGIINPKKNLHAFGFARLEQEPEYIHAVSQRHPMAATHIFSVSGVSAEDRTNQLKRSLNILGYPVEHGNATGHEPFYHMAEQFNIRTLLSGHGGDEFVTNPAHLALTEWLYDKKWQHLYLNITGNHLTRVLRIIKRIKMQTQQTSYRFEKVFKQRWQHQLINQATVAEFDLYQRYLESARYDEGYQRLNDFVLQNRWAPFVSTRMENCSLMAAARKIEYRWPLLDVRLVQFFLSVPSEQKYAHGVGRLLHRRAIDHIVPHKVTWKSTKYMGVNQVPKDNQLFTLIEIAGEELHEMLSKLIDLEKLTIQKGRILSGDKHEVIQIRRNLNNLQYLSHWLFGIS